MISYRHTDNIKSDGYVYDNQIQAAKNIIDHFVNKTRWVLLLAETQSGKTGVLNSVPYIILSNEGYKDRLGIKGYDHVFILTGMSNTDLRDQFIKKSMIITGSTKITILMNSDLQKIVKNTYLEDPDITNRFNNALFIIDESHYGTDEGSMLDKFLINTLLNLEDEEHNEKLNNYFLSVSATPMAESISNSFINNKKEKVILQNGPGYYSICDMFDNKGTIEDSFVFSSIEDYYNGGDLYSFVDRIKNVDNGYIIIRLNGNKQEILKEAIKLEGLIENKDIFYESFDGDSNKKSINNIIGKIPNNEISNRKKVIVFIKGKLRAGIEVDTKYVSMVHDTFASNTDTLVQSLVGRLTGYNKNRNIKIFTNREKCEEYKNWVQNNFHVSSTPSNCKNVRNQKGTKSFNTSYKVHIPAIEEIIINDKVAELVKLDARKFPKRNELILKEVLDPKKEEHKIILDLLNSSDLCDIRLNKANKKSKTNYDKMYTPNKKGGIASDFKSYDKKGIILDKINKLFINIVYEADCIDLRNKETDITIGNKLIINVGKSYIKKNEITNPLANVYLDEKSIYTNI